MTQNLSVFQIMHTFFRSLRFDVCGDPRPCMCETLKVKLARRYQPGLTALLAADSVVCSVLYMY